MSANIFSSSFVEQLKTEIAGEVINQITGLLTKTQTPSPETEYITRKQAKAILKVSDPTMIKWDKEGKTKAYRIGSQVRYKKHELEQFLSNFNIGG